MLFVYFCDYGKVWFNKVGDFFNIVFIFCFGFSDIDFVIIV